MHPDLSGNSERLRHCGLPCLHGAAVLHRLDGSLSRPAVLGSDACAPGETVMDERTAHKSVGVLAVVAALIAASEAGTSRIHRDSE
jgi:hypothetical protein